MSKYAPNKSVTVTTSSEAAKRALAITAAHPNSKVGTDVSAIRADLTRLTKDLLEAGQAYATARRDSAQKSLEAKLGYVQTYMATDASLKVDERKSVATIDNYGKQAAADLAEAEADALKMVIKTLSDALNSTQTQARLLRDEITLTEGTAF